MRLYDMHDVMIGRHAWVYREMDKDGKIIPEFYDGTIEKKPDGLYLSNGKKEIKLENGDKIFLDSRGRPQEVYTI